MHADWPAENIILALLCERPMHGYEVAQLLKSDAALRAIWRIETSEVYFLLRKLLKREFIEEQAEEQGAGPRRVIYAPTPAGRAALEGWLITPERYPRNLRTALLARIYLALRSDPPLAVGVIDAQRELLADWLDRERGRTFGDEVVTLVHRFRAAQVEAMLAALDDLHRLAAARAEGSAQSSTAS